MESPGEGVAVTAESVVEVVVVVVGVNESVLLVVSDCAVDTSTNTALQINCNIIRLSIDYRRNRVDGRRESRKEKKKGGGQPAKGFI